MSKLSLNQLRELYSAYSPLSSSKQLYNKYIEITGESYQSIESIRTKYNYEIFKGFLNEAVIKTSFVEKYCINKSPKNTITIFELNAGNSRADICMVNGESFVFEIKTEFDTFIRLDKQISDYEKTFDYLNIIIPEKLLESTLQSIDSTIGIITYRLNRVKRINFNVYRQPKLNKNIDPKIQLAQLTKKQLKQICTSHESKDELIDNILKSYSKNEINKLYKTNIKEKYKKQWKFLLENKDNIEPLDYQWFFHNNISTEIVYK